MLFSKMTRLEIYFIFLIRPPPKCLFANHNFLPGKAFLWVMQRRKDTKRAFSPHPHVHPYGVTREVNWMRKRLDL